MSLNEFLHMGGYAFYVWTSYGIALIILLANILLPARQRSCSSDLETEPRSGRS